MTEQFFEKELACRKIEQIPGFLEFDIPVHGDNRGWFKENFQKEKMVPLGFPESFFAAGKLQNNVSFSRKNVLRGLHAEPWDKYISVADGGRVLGTWVDLRAGESFGATYQTIIDASKGVFVPRGVANGFQVLSDSVSYSYLVNDYWALELKPKYAFVNYADPALGIEWEDLAHAEVSEADKHHPMLADVVPLVVVKNVTDERLSYPEGEEPDFMSPQNFVQNRYVLGKKGKHPLFVVCMNPSAAGMDWSDRTVNTVARLAKDNGYEGWFVFNIYPERATDAEKLDPYSKDEDLKNVKEIEKIIDEYKVREVLGAWGETDLEQLRNGRNTLLRLFIKKGVSVVATHLNSSGNPHHLSRIENDLKKTVEVDINKLLHEK